MAYAPSGALAQLAAALAAHQAAVQAGGGATRGQSFPAQQAQLGAVPHQHPVLHGPTTNPGGVMQRPPNEGGVTPHPPTFGGGRPGGGLPQQIGVGGGNPEGGVTPHPPTFGGGAPQPPGIGGAVRFPARPQRANPRPVFYGNNPGLRMG